MESEFAHFYKRSRAERLALLAQHRELTPAMVQLLSDRAAQGDAQQLIENDITAFQLPEGVAVNLMVNQRELVVPMVTEEPSVIAAASNGAKQLAKAGGIQATVQSRLLMGQVVLSHVKVFASVDDWVALHQTELLEVAAQAHPSIVKRGGGPRKLRTRDLGDGYVSIDLFADVQAAMGATCSIRCWKPLRLWFRLNCNSHFSVSSLTLLIRVWQRQLAGSRNPSYPLGWPNESRKPVKSPNLIHTGQ